MTVYWYFATGLPRRYSGISRIETDAESGIVYLFRGDDAVDLGAGGVLVALRVYPDNQHEDRQP